MINRPGLTTGAYTGYAMETDATNVKAGGQRMPPNPYPNPSGVPDGDVRHPGTRAFHHFRRLIDELKDEVSFYIGAKSDALKYSAKKIGIYAGLGVVGLFVAIAFLATACVLLLVGAADGISRACGTGPWLGDLIVAVVVLGGVGVGAMIVLKKIFNSSKKQTVERYEQLKRSQRTKFGQSVADRAAAANGHGKT